MQRLEGMGERLTRIKFFFFFFLNIMLTGKKDETEKAINDYFV